MALYGSLPGDSRNMAENQECSPECIMNAVCWWFAAESSMIKVNLRIMNEKILKQIIPLVVKSNVLTHQPSLTRCLAVTSLAGGPES